MICPLFAVAEYFCSILVVPPEVVNRIAREPLVFPSGKRETGCGGVRTALFQRFARQHLVAAVLTGVGRQTVWGKGEISLIR